jgi:HK97 family phage portal protein
MTGSGATLAGFKQNGPPGGWVSTNGPVWWVGSDRAYLAPGQVAGMSAITRATNLIVNRIAAAPWEVAGDQPRWVSDPMLLRPDDRYSSMYPAAQRLPRSVFWAQLIRSALSWGMGYLVFVEDAAGMPLAGTLALLSPSVVETDPRERGVYRRVGPYPGIDVGADGRLQGTPYRMVELRNPTTPVDELTGTTPGTLAYHAAEFGMMADQLAYAVGMYSGNGVPSGYIKVNTPQLSQAQVDTIGGNWMAAHGSGGRKVAVLPGNADYTPIGISPVDAALVEMKRLSLQDVANAYGVPGNLIGAPEGGSMTYSNVEMQMQALYEFTLRPWAVAVEETLSALLPAGTTLDIRPAGEIEAGGGGGAVIGSGTVAALADVPAG